MIHQYIFAGPKPGLSPDAFQSYWVNFHAVNYAAKIPQIRQYLVAPRNNVKCGRDVPFFAGVAEIWLENDAEQLASLQSSEFINGARADEPRWAAYWQTLGLDTETETLRGTSAPGASRVQLYLLLRRRSGLSLKEFRAALMADRRGRAQDLYPVLCHEISFARDALYGLGEPRFDAIEVLSFADEASLNTALGEGGLGREIETGWPFIETQYLFTFSGREHWIIRADAPVAPAH